MNTWAWKPHLSSQPKLSPEHHLWLHSFPHSPHCINHKVLLSYLNTSETLNFPNHSLWFHSNNLLIPLGLNSMAPTLSHSHSATHSLFFHTPAIYKHFLPHFHLCSPHPSFFILPIWKTTALVTNLNLRSFCTCTQAAKCGWRKRYSQRPTRSILYSCPFIPGGSLG